MSPPCSTQATHGSVKSSSRSKSTKGKSKSSAGTVVTDEAEPCTPHSSTFTSTSADNEDQSGQRTTGYLADPINSNPEYKYSTSAESIHDHKASMKAYLDAFDKGMMQYDHKEDTV